MDRAELTLAASLHALVKNQASITNNIANAQSVGYRRRAGTFIPFENQLEKAAGIKLTTPLYREFGDFSQGRIQQTEDRFNIALQGEGFFQVRRPGESGKTYFTRVGTLKVDPNGTLLTGEGMELLSAQGTPIRISTGAAFKVDSKGEIQDLHTGEVLGQIGLWKFQNPTNLRPLGAGLFEPTPSAGTPARDRFTTVSQGSLESSNVDTMQELVGMITVQRHFQSVTRALSVVEQTADRLNQLAQG
ncbi:MAG TPA: flagellar hook basal-body protein [Planctomycetes bacterium]|nr:flagellar hook basal-body protein [Planctomycetota bacterium]